MFKKIISWGMIASLFMDDFIILRFRLPIDLYVYYIFFIFNISYYVFQKKTLKKGKHYAKLWEKL